MLDNDFVKEGTVSNEDQGVGNDNNDDDDNHVVFPADSSMVVNKTACVTNCVLENLLKTLVEWSTDEMLHCDYLLKLNEFYNLPENALNYLSQKLLLGLKLMTLIWSMGQAMLDKLDAVHTDVARHVGALKSNDCN